MRKKLNKYQNPFYVSDLDGTLLRSNATLSSYSKKILQQLLHEGLHFTVASARSVFSMWPILDGLRLSLPVIEFNGAFISDLETGKHIVTNSIDSLVARKIYQLILGCGHLPFISTFNGTTDRLYYSRITNMGMQWYFENRQQNQDKRLRKTRDLAETLAEEIMCFTIIDSSESLYDLKSILKKEYNHLVEIHFQENLYSPSWYWLTIHDHKATKDKAISWIRTENGLVKNELVVFGDHTNDIKMFQIADRRIAVKNAIIELKQQATHIIESNQSDGVVKYVENDWTNGE
ncbi:MAG: HAD family hydrolase [Candidatus Poribacteria bacterium]